MIFLNVRIFLAKQVFASVLYYNIMLVLDEVQSFSESSADCNSGSPVYRRLVRTASVAPKRWLYLYLQVSSLKNIVKFRWRSRHFVLVLFNKYFIFPGKLLLKC